MYLVPHGVPGFSPPVSGFGHTPGFFFGGCLMADCAVLFVDGNNWYHSLSEAGVSDLGRLDYAKISEKLVGPRTWIGTRYYIGQVQQKGNSRLYADQRRFLAHLRASDPRISVHFGRLEDRQVKNEAALQLRQYLSGLTVRIRPDADWFGDCY